MLHVRPYAQDRSSPSAKSTSSISQESSSPFPSGQLPRDVSNFGNKTQKGASQIQFGEDGDSWQTTQRMSYHALAKNKLPFTAQQMKKQGEKSHWDLTSHAGNRQTLTSTNSAHFGHPADKEDVPWPFPTRITKKYDPITGEKKGMSAGGRNFPRKSTDHAHNQPEFGMNPITFKANW
jgi:hypothetical protein